MNREELEAELEQIELRELALTLRIKRTNLRQLEAAERAKRANLRKQESAERAKRTGRINIEALREQIKTGLLKDGRGVKSTKLRETSYAWRKLLNMLRQPNESPQRLEAEGILRQLKVSYDDGDHRGKGYMRMFFYEPVDIPMTEPADVKVW